MNMHFYSDLCHTLISYSNTQAWTIHRSHYPCCLQRACNDTPSSCLSWRKAKTLLFTLNQKIKLFWWLSAHAHISLIAHEVISINNSSCLLQRSHLSRQSNQMSTATLSNGTYGAHIGTLHHKNKWSKIRPLITRLTFQQIKYRVQAYIKHQGREKDF